MVGTKDGYGGYWIFPFILPYPSSWRADNMSMTVCLFIRVRSICDASADADAEADACAPDTSHLTAITTIHTHIALHRALREVGGIFSMETIYNMLI